MKLAGSNATAYLRKPDPAHAGVLLFGTDAMRVATKRKDLIETLVGPNGEEEMRLTRINAGDLRKDPALINDAIKAQGFFPGHRVAFVEDATDGLSKVLQAALTDWQPGDAQVVVAAGSLTAKSALRKLFEGHPNAVAIGIYDDPPGRDDVEQALSKAGIADIPRDAMDAIMSLASSLDPGDFRQTLEKLGLYKLKDTSPVSLDDISACAPLSAEAELDDLLDVVTNGNSDKLGPTLANLYAQGTQPVAICIMATRHFRRMHIVASDPGGVGSGIGKLRPPVFGPRRDKLARQTSNWGRDRLERALSTLMETDLTLRSTSQAPAHAVMERALIRLAMMARR